MRRALFLALPMFLLFGCPDPNGNDGGTGGGAGGGSGGSGGATGFDIQTLDSTRGDRRWLAAAYEPNANKIGVAYFVNLGTFTSTLPDGGTVAADGGAAGGFIDYAIRYIEWKNGVVSAPETIVAKVNVAIGLSLAFQPNGEPAVTFIGGGNEEGSLIWLQNDLMLGRRSAGNWTVSTLTPNGLGYACGNGVSDGPQFVAGVWSALAFDSTGKGYVVWRNVHNGQFPVQDWQSSDAELEVLAPGAGSGTHYCLAEGGNSKSAWGGRNMLVMAKDQPMVIFDQCDVNGPEAEGRNVIWMRRKDNSSTVGTWSPPRTAQPVGNTQTGATLAYDDLGDGGTYGIAVVDRGSDTLKYIESGDGEAWTFPDSVYASGSGGWYPSLAFDPINHEPAIAWYLCSLRSGVDESSCPAAEDALKISQRIVGNWRTVTVDNDGAFLPRMGFLKSGKYWVAYRARGAGELKLAIQK